MSPAREQPLRAHAVILAGGRGTRFWPRSRIRTPKQLLNIVGQRTMLQQTAARLAPLFSPARLWAVTNQEQAPAVRRQMPGISAGHILAEPAGRNTAAAIGLAAIHLARESYSADALMAVLPADHFIAQEARYRRIVLAALEMAARPGTLVALGIPPTRPETGYGYIERGRLAGRPGGLPAYAVRRFVEKPALVLARRYAASGRYDWNAGMFFWRVSTYLDHLREFLPTTYRALMRLADTIGTPRYSRALRHAYARLENVSVDYAVLEPASRKPGHVFVLPAAVGWSDIGSWAAVHELLGLRGGANVSAGPLISLGASGCFFWVPGKHVAALGVRDLVVVETPDALLVCPRDRAQDVGQIVKELEKQKRTKLL
jgi:mannose-1-phosphate guanylyltransferase